MKEFMLIVIWFMLFLMSQNDQIERAEILKEIKVVRPCKWQGAENEWKRFFWIDFGSYNINSTVEKKEMNVEDLKKLGIVYLTVSCFPNKHDGKIFVTFQTPEDAKTQEFQNIEIENFNDIKSEIEKKLND